MSENLNPFDGNFGITPEGRKAREEIKVEDALLCEANEESEEINKLIADTMAFISQELQDK